MRISLLLVQIPVFLVFVYISKFKAVKVLFVNLTIIAIASSLSLIGFAVSHIFVVSVLIFTLTVSAYFQIFRSFKHNHEQLILQNEQNLLRTQIAAAQMHLEALKESQDKTINYRHDMRHHLALIGAKLVDNKLEAAENGVFKTSLVL